MAKLAFLVDDSKSARIVLGRLLKKNGFDNVEMAESGEQALEMLRNMTPDAIFVDFLMDGMDGLETITEIKKDQRFSQTPVVMCTANEGDRYVQAAVEHGALGILAKPPTDESLNGIMRQIESQQQQAEPEQPMVVETATPAVSEESIRQVAADTARQVVETELGTLVQERIEEAAKQSARSIMDEMLVPTVSSLVSQQLKQTPPATVDTEALRSEVVTQVNQDLQEFVRQINQRTVEGLIEASIYEQVHELANDFTQRLQDLKTEILNQVPEKNDMIEHIRVLTEGSIEAQVRETASQVSQEVANSIATETVEQILDQHLADQTMQKTSSNEGKSGKIILWLLLFLLGAGVGYGIYYFSVLS